MLDDLRACIERLAVVNYELGRIDAEHRLQETLESERDHLDDEITQIVDALGKGEAS